MPWIPPILNRRHDRESRALARIGRDEHLAEVRHDIERLRERQQAIRARLDALEVRVDVLSRSPRRDSRETGPPVPPVEGAPR